MRVLMILSVVLIITCFIINSNREDKIRNAPALYEDIELLVGCAKSKHIKNAGQYLSKLHVGIKHHQILKLNEDCHQELEASKSRALINSVRPESYSDRPKAYLVPPKAQNEHSQPDASQATQPKEDPKPKYENLADSKYQIPTLNSEVKN